MKTPDTHLWKQVLEQFEDLVPINYYKYKTAPVHGSVIASDKGGLESVVFDLVTKIFKKAYQKNNIALMENKTAVSCELTLEDGSRLTIFFSCYEHEYSISTKIRSEDHNKFPLT